MSVSENPDQNFFNLSIDMLCIAGYDGYFKHLNPAWSQTLGFTNEELMARPYLDFVHPDDRAATVQEAEKIALGSRTIHFRNRYECRNGGYRWLAWTASPSDSAKLIYAVARDITHEVEAADHLEAANRAADTRLAMLTALVNSIGVGVVLIDPDLRVVHWNNEATRLTGIPSEHALGAPARRIGEALSGRVEDYAGLQSHFRSGLSPAEPFRFNIVTLDPHREVEVYVSRALSASDRSVVGSVLVLTDVSAAKELERAKDELVAMVSHELRTPLASVVGFTELLLERELPEARQKQYLATMLKEGRRLTDMINDFLDLQGLEGGYKRLDLGPADLRSLVDRAVRAAGQQEQTPIQVDLAQELPLVLADSNAVHQVLLNLISNSRKYSPGGGSIVVAANVRDGAVEVSVRDHGLGIPAEALPKLFNKFYRVPGADRKQIPGTGLGLTISRRIIDGHGGQIWAESNGRERGSRFAFTLRIATAGSQSGDVLIVEDDAGFARLVEAELTSQGVTSMWAPDAETAAQLIAHASPRVVVVDLLLPGLSGEEFMARLNSPGRRVPVIVVSIKDLEPDEMLALRSAGAVAILKKHSGAARDAAIYVATTLSRTIQPSG